MKTVLFVCTGNTCRSPMAEGLFNAATAREGLDVRALSCGISAVAPTPATEAAVNVAAQYGADISKHCARAVSETLVGAADQICCMTQGHLDVLEIMFPAHALRMSTVAPTDIADPFGGGAEEYEETGRQLSQAVEKLIRQYIRERDAG